MRLLDTFQGRDHPFEGDRTLWLFSLPDGARATKATISLVPAAHALPPTEDEKLFEEVFTFEEGNDDPLVLVAEEWGITGTEPGAFFEVDFHNRHTLAGVEGKGGNAEMQVDLGGGYIGVAKDGTFNLAKGALSITLAEGAEFALPGLTVSKFKLSQGTGNTTNLDVTKVRIRSTPMNVSARLGQMPPFWTRTGELATAQGETSPDFAAVLNAFLSEETAENGFYTIPIVIHSDTIARLDVRLMVDYVIEQPVLPPHLSEVTIPFDYSTLPGVAQNLLKVDLPRNAQGIVETGGDVLGTFEASRVISGEIGEIGATDLVTISPGYTLAQPIRMSEETPVSGIDLPLANTDPGTAGLHLALQKDSGGKPGGEVLTSAEVTVTRPAPGSSAWGSATLATEFRFLAGEQYWLVLQSLAGKAKWGVQSGDAGGPFLLASADNGFSWRAAATEAGEKSLTALLRLRHTPEWFTMPLQLQIGKGPGAVPVKFDRFESLGRVEFGLDFAAGLEKYITSGAVGPICGRGELLTNGSFEQPRHDDATRRLFIYDAIKKKSGPIESVDLSAGANLGWERFIWLSVNDDLPRRIDCASSSGDPARARAEEIAGAIREEGAPWSVDVVEKSTDPPPRTYKLLEINGTGSTEGTVTLEPVRREETPLGWEQPPEAGGRIWRAKWPTMVYYDTDSSPSEEMPASRSERLIVGLEPGNEKPAILAQRISAASACVYTLSFFFQTRETGTEDNSSMGQERAFFFSSTDPIPELYRPFWEVRWLTAEGRLIDRERQSLDPSSGFPWDENGMQWVEVRLVAPSETAQAEIRFTQPPYDEPDPFILDDVSFKPVFEALRNSDFVQAVALSDTVLAPLHWNREGGLIQLDLVKNILDDTIRVNGVELNGDGFQDTTLTQVVDITGGERYELKVKAWPETPLIDDLDLAPVQWRSRLALRWFKDTEMVGDEIVLPLDDLGFQTHAWAGAAPADATQAEVQFIQPRGAGSLLVESVDLVQMDMVTMPLIFLAEAPGELVVSNPIVVYDPPQPPSAPELFVPLPTTGEPVPKWLPPWKPPWRPPIILWPPPVLVDGGIPWGPGSIFAGLRASLIRLSTTASPQPPTPLGEIVAAAPPVSPLATRSAGDIAGVSENVAGILAGLTEPVNTIAELATLDPATDTGISRLLALKSAAELIMALDINPAPFSQLYHKSLEAFMTWTPDELAQKAGQSTDRAEELQRDLRALRLLINNDTFRSLHLADLISPNGV